MATPSIESFLELVRKSGVVEEPRLNAYLEKLRAADHLPGDPAKLAGMMIRDALLTQFQAEQVLSGKWRGFHVGKYRILERLGSGGMGTVYLAAHKFMRRRVAVKVLPKSKANDPSSLERFYREAKAVAALDHPNIVRAFDIDQDGDLHFLVMEYVDGLSLQEIVKKTGVMNPLRAAHYVRQGALGLEHANDIGLVHRDIKPGNLLVDRGGVVKILDMGLARFFNDTGDILTKKYDENVLGTADYLAPEQAIDSHNVDIRADIYSLGCTFYFTLTGRPPFGDGSVAQKLIWHQTRQPKPLKELRPDLPDALVQIIQKMMGKSLEERYQKPMEVALALEPFTQTPIPPPAEEELPKLSPASQALAGDGTGTGTTAPAIAALTTTLKKSAPGSESPPAGSAAGSKPASGPAQERSQPRAPMESPASPGPKGEPGPKRSSDPGKRDAAYPKRPAAATAPAAPQRVPAKTSPTAVKPAPEKENSPWAALDTPDPAAEAQDTLSSGNKPVTRGGLRSIAAGQQVDRRKLMVIIGCTIFGVVAVFGVTYLVAFSGGGKSRSPGDGGSGRGQVITENPGGEAHVEKAAKPGPQGKQPAVTHYVAKNDPNARTNKTLNDAIRAANPGDTIVVTDNGVYEEQLNLTPNSGGKRDLTIRTDAGATLQQPYQAAGGGGPLVVIDGMPGLKLIGFTLDGRGRAADLVKITGNCPGLLFENLKLQGFNDTGIQLDMVRGLSLKKVEFNPLRALGQSAQAALVFLPPAKQPAAQHMAIRVEECRFEGSYQDVIRIQGHLNACTFSNNIFFGGKKTAFAYAPDQAPLALEQVRIANNTFYEFEFAIHLRALPHFRSKIEVSNNIFSQLLAGVGQIDGVPPDQLVGMVEGEGNVMDFQSKAGNLPMKITSIAFKLPTDPKDPERFLRYPKNDPLNSAGKNLSPVGALPPLP